MVFLSLLNTEMVQAVMQKLFHTVITDDLAMLGANCSISSFGVDLVLLEYFSFQPMKDSPVILSLYYSILIVS